MKKKLLKRNFFLKIIKQKQMLNKITYAGAILAAAALASEELEMDHDEARLLADQFSKDPSFGEHARLLSSEFASEGASDEERELHWTGPYGPWCPWWSWFSPWWNWGWPYYRMGYCRMRYCPENRTTYPYGAFYFYEGGAYAPMRISGYMRNMPPGNNAHGVRINRDPYSYWCNPTEPTFNPFGVSEGRMNTWPSRVGDLDPIYDFSGNASYLKRAWQPSFYGGSSNISNRSMCIYERYYEYNSNTGRKPYEPYFGRKIACCSIRRTWVWRTYNDLAMYQTMMASELDRSIDYITEAQYGRLMKKDSFDLSEYQDELREENDEKDEDGNEKDSKDNDCDNGECKEDLNSDELKKLDAPGRDYDGL